MHWTILTFARRSLLQCGRMEAARASITRLSPRPGIVRSAMGGFFLLGSLMALLGAFLPVWTYTIQFDLATAGDYFVAFNLGLFAAAVSARQNLGRLGLRRLLVAACLGTGLTLLLLSAILSPAGLIFPLIVLGFAAGTLTTGVSWLLFDAMTAPLTFVILSLAGVFFGCGAVSFTLLIWASVHNLTAQRTLVLASVLPLLLGLRYLRQRSLAEPALQTAPLGPSPGTSRSSPAVLLSLALFFQSGSEWTVGGWLAFYWIRRLGVNLEAALGGLALYWTALTLGKLLGSRALSLAAPFRVLSAGTGAALFGCVLLLSAAGPGGAAVGTLLVGAGLGLVYPVGLGILGRRFPYYHPGFFNGLFSLSLIGGMLVPWTVGHLANAWVIQAAIWVPALGAVMVYVLLSFLLLEARVSRMVNTVSSN